MRLDDGDLLAPPHTVGLVRDYALRWGIETLFGILKTRGFCLQSTHFTDPDRLRQLFALLTLALVWSLKTGLWLHQLHPIPLKNPVLRRRTFHEREQLDKNKNSLINQLRQRLCCEHPEIAQRDFDYIGVNGHNPTLAHIAGLRNNPRIKTTAGTGISEYSRLLAKDIVMYQTRISIKEAELREILELEQFKDYCQVFAQFLFGTVTQSLLLLHFALLSYREVPSSRKTLL
ncbi:MAG: transposase [Microcystis aeruginosa W11-06]|nr:transposase [Microcystis aeruginosa W11-06]